MIIGKLTSTKFNPFQLYPMKKCCRDTDISVDIYACNVDMLNSVRLRRNQLENQKREKKIGRSFGDVEKILKFKLCMKFQ